MRHPQGFRIFDAPVRDQEVEGSNPFAPTIFSKNSHAIFVSFRLQLGDCVCLPCFLVFSQ